MSLARRIFADGHAVPQPGEAWTSRMIRGNPVDGVVLLCGCDKTTPSLIDGRGELRSAAGRVGGAMLNVISRPAIGRNQCVADE